MEMMTILFVVCLLLLVGFSGSLLYAAKKQLLHAAVSEPEPKTLSSGTDREPEPEQPTGSDPKEETSAPDEEMAQPDEEAELPETENENSPKPSEPIKPEAAQAKKKASSPLFEIAVDLLAILFIVVGCLDLLNIVDFAQYDGAFTLCGAAGILEYFVYMITRKKECRTVRFFGKFLLVVTILELTLFQLPSYQVMFDSGYEETEIHLTDALCEGGVPSFGEMDGEKYTMISGTQEVIFSFNNLQQRVGSIAVDFELSSNATKAHVLVDITDDTTDSYRYNIAEMVLSDGNTRTGYVACQFSGDVQNMRLKFSCYEDEHALIIKSVTLNAPLAFNVSAVRFLLILVLGTFAYAIVCSPLLRRSYENARISSRVGSIAITCVMLALACTMVISELGTENFSQHFQNTQGNQISQELVDAFENGQLHLLDEPSQELLALENPYDRATREAAGVSLKWDHVLYEGKYYSYYGIAPVLLLFLPYHMITGFYFSTDLAVLLFSLIGIVFLALTYTAIIKRWFSKVPVACVLAGLTVLFSVCGIWYSLGRPLFYEISISSGFAFVAMGAYFLFSSNVLSSGKTSLVRIALASLFSGLAVLCRPTLAVYSICTCLFFLFGFKKSGQIPAEDGTVRNCRIRQIGYVLCALLPLMTLGIIQMWYNYARFDSPLDFGIQYSLTINDFTAAEYHTHFVLIGLYNYLFAAPNFSTHYPFITTPFARFGVSGYYFSDNGNTSGIIFLAFPVLGYLLAPRALRRTENRRQRWQWVLLIGMSCILMPLVILFSIWESGYAVRYVADFSWQIVIGALAILFFLYQKTQNETKKNFLHWFMAVSVVAAVILNGMQIFSFSFPDGSYPELSRQVDQMFAFWKG